MHELISKALMMRVNDFVTFNLFWDKLEAWNSPVPINLVEATLWGNGRLSVMNIWTFSILFYSFSLLLYLSLSWTAPFYQTYCALISFIFIPSIYFSLSLRDFLPRGSGIVTRRPLILQLVNNKAGECTNPVLRTGWSVYSFPVTVPQAMPTVCSLLPSSL